MRLARRASLRLLAIAMVCCAILPLALLVSGAIVVRRVAGDEADARLVRTTDILHEQALKVFQTTDLLLTTLAEMTRDVPDQAMRTDFTHWHDLLRAISGRLPQVQSIWIAGPDGRVSATDYVAALPALDLSTRDYFAAHVGSHVGAHVGAHMGADAGTYVGAVLTPLLDSGLPFFSISRRRPTHDGAFAGIITVSLLPADFEKFYREIGSTPGSFLGMYRTDGIRLARFPPVPPQVQAGRPPILAAIASGGERGLLTQVSSIDGIERRLAWRRLDPYPVFVLAGLETSAIRTEWLATLASHLLFGIPATLALLATMAVAIARTRDLFDEAERRATAEERLQRAQRLEALGELTGGVAHDFNNLLMIVLGSVDRLRGRPREAADIRSLDMITTAVRRGETLTRQLLAFARRRALYPKPIDLAAALADMRGLLEHSLRTDITLTLEADGPPADYIICVDPSELELAVLNIAVNARDAMPAGGSVSVRLRRFDLAATDRAEGLEGAFVAISFSDTGRGIAPDVLPRVFNPFFTTKDVGQGTGLGLSQVYGFARQSGGTATIESTPGTGTTVTLILPHSNERPAPQADPGRSVTEPGAGLRALLVEDNPDVAAVTRARLQMLGFDVTVAASARTALSLLELRGYALVLTDVQMPGGISGLDLLHRLRDQGITVPVILATGYGIVADQARRDGCFVLQKPYDEDRLRDAVTAALQGAPAPVDGED